MIPGSCDGIAGGDRSSLGDQASMHACAAHYPIPRLENQLLIKQRV